MRLTGHRNDLMWIRADFYVTPQSKISQKYIAILQRVLRNSLPFFTNCYNIRHGYLAWQ